MTVRNHPAGQPARTRISHLVMLALLTGASGQVGAAEGPNLNPFTDFGGSWRFEGAGGNLSRVTPPRLRGNQSLRKLVFLYRTRERH